MEQSEITQGAPRFGRIKEVQRLFGIAPSTVYELIKKGQFPKPLKMGRCSVWSFEEIEQALKSCPRAEIREIKTQSGGARHG